jgi:hypothetical protein
MQTGPISLSFRARVSANPLAPSGMTKERPVTMLMRPEKPNSPLKAALLRMADNFIAKINSSSFAAAQRRRALAGLDAKQLADIGLTYVDGDYRPHPDAAK